MLILCDIDESNSNARTAITVRSMQPGFQRADELEPAGHSLWPSTILPQIVRFAINMTSPVRENHTLAQVHLALALRVAMLKEIGKVTFRGPEPPSQVAPQSLIGKMPRRQRTRILGH